MVANGRLDRNSHIARDSLHPQCNIFLGNELNFAVLPLRSHDSGISEIHLFPLNSPLFSVCIWCEAEMILVLYSDYIGYDN